MFYVAILYSMIHCNRLLHMSIKVQQPATTVKPALIFHPSNRKWNCWRRKLKNWIVREGSIAANSRYSFSSACCYCLCCLLVLYNNKKTLNILKLTILTGLLFSQSRIQYLNYKSLKSPHNLRVLLVLCWFIIFYIFYIFCFLLFLFFNSQFFIPQETPKQQHKNILSVLFETLNRVQ